MLAEQQSRQTMHDARQDAVPSHCSLVLLKPCTCGAPSLQLVWRGVPPPACLIGVEMLNAELQPGSCRPGG